MVIIISELAPCSLWTPRSENSGWSLHWDKLEEWYIVTELFVLKFEVDVTEVKIKKSYSNQAIEKEEIVFY